MFKTLGRRTVLLSFALMMFVTLFTGHTTFAQPAYDYDVIAQTGVPVIDPDPSGGGNTGPLVDLGRGPSLNNLGKVGFIARDQAGSFGRVIVKNNKVIERNFSITSLQIIGNEIQLNDSNQVTWQDKVTLNNDTFVRRLDSNSGGVSIGIGSNFFTTPFSMVVAGSTINQGGRVAFTGDLKTGGTVLANRADGTSAHNRTNAVGGFPTFYSMMADNNTTIIRKEGTPGGGAANASLILLSDATFTSGFFIAGPPAFSAIGGKPGLSDDGRVISFLGVNATTGTGIFAEIGGGVLSFKIAGISGDGHLDPEETFVDTNGNGQFDSGEPDTGYFNSFSSLQRVGVNQAVPGQSSFYTIAYVAMGSGSLGTTNQIGLYTSSADISQPANPVITPPSLVVEVGGTIPGVTGTVQEIGTYDPINTQGQVVFWVKTTTNAQAIVRGSPSRLVQWESGQPIKDAVIEAYYIAGSVTNPEIKPLPLLNLDNVTKSRQDGSFCLPPELNNFQNPPADEIYPPRRGIRAKITYMDKTKGSKDAPTGTTYTTINYPDWDPLRPFKQPTAGHLVIYFPNPVFFVPGMNGVVNAAFVDTNGVTQDSYDDSDGKIRAFMNLQNGASPSEILALANTYAMNDTNSKTWNAAEWNQKLAEWVNIKRSDNPKLRVPAFVMFTIPTFLPKDILGNTDTRICLPSGVNDKIEWGIKACGTTFDDRITLSAENIQAHFNQNIKSEMSKLTPNGFAEVPFDVMAHSLGGVIARHWLTGKKDTQSYPVVDHYVTFDSPHGGVKLVGTILRYLNNWWAEARMNGTSNIDNDPPIANNEGWNYKNRLDHNPKHLLFSAEGDSLIAPNGATGTALGRGRIMKPTTLFTFFHDLLFTHPNGYCERFVGGWGLQVFKNPAPKSSPYEAAKTHSIQNEPIAFIPAARFLANGNTPALGTYVAPGAVTTAATDMSFPGGACQPENSALAPSLVKVVLNAPAGTQQNQTAYFDANTTLTISAILSDPGATLVLLNSSGVPIPRFNETQDDMEGGGKAVSFDVNVLAGTGTLRLSAGTVEAGAVAVIDYKNDRYATASAFNLHNTRGNQVAVNAVVLDTGDAPLIGNGGTGQVTITKADGTDVVLPLFDDGLHSDGPVGDGIYGALLPGTNTTEAARYSLAVNMTIDMGGGIFVNRTGEGMFFVDYDQANPLGVTAENAVDANSNGLSDAVEIAMNINFTANGTFSLNADLMAGGVKIDSLRNVFDVTNAPEVKTVSFKIPAKRIQEMGAPGALTLASIDLYENTHAMYAGSIPDYTTQSYSPVNFDLPPAPFIAGCLPSFGRREGGDEVIINGREFDNVTAVYFNTAPATFKILNDSALLVTAPAWDGVNEKVDIRVVTPWNETSKGGIFEYAVLNQPPVINSIVDKTVNEGQLLQFNVSATDPDGNPLVLSARLGSGAALSTIGATFTDNGNGTGAFSWTPGFTQSGVYPIVFQASDGSLGDEQTITVTVNDVPAPDLLLTALSTTTTAIAPGNPMSAANTVKNQGTAAAGAFVNAFHLSTDTVYGNADDIVFTTTRSIASLAVGASSAATTSNLTVPAGTPAGNYFLCAKADNNATVLEQDENNNTRCTATTVKVAPADLVMTAISGPASGLTGATISVTDTVRNQGQGSITASFIVGYYLSLDAVITTADTRIGTRTVTSLAANTSKSGTVAVTVPSTLAPGTYYLGAIADYTNVRLEQDENNNSLAGNTITLTPGADLVISSVSAPATGSTANTISVTSAVMDQGPGAAASFSVGLYISTDAAITTADRRLGARSVSSLASGAASTASTTVTIPNTLAPGTYYIGAIADYLNARPEINEANNSLAGNQINVVSPDLVMTVISGPASGTRGGTISLSDTAGNQGAGNAASFTIGLYFSTDATITTADRRVGTRSVSSLASGAANPGTTIVTIPGTLVVGTYYVGAIADYNNSRAESNETNNALAGNVITIQ